MIDLTKPIRTKGDGRPARLLATDIDDAWPIAIAHEKTIGAWEVALYSEAHITLCFENIPPEPNTVRLYVWWDHGDVSIASANEEDAKRWRNLGWKVSEHLVTEPQS